MDPVADYGGSFPAKGLVCASQKSVTEIRRIHHGDTEEELLEQEVSLGEVVEVMTM